MMRARIQGTRRFGDNELPSEQQEALRKAIRIERITIVIRIITVWIIFMLAGSSQAMKAAWIEDSLSLLPPLAFLIAIRFIRREPSAKHPFGYHRSIGVGHLVAATALLGLGAYLFIDSVMGLVTVEHPPIGVIEIFGTPIWAGWLMAVASALVSVPSVVLGYIKTKLAPVLHNKILFADADMNRADWTTGFATSVGILGIGAGFWWADSVAAALISLGIVKDGLTNLRSCLADLIDARATTTDSRHPHPLIAKIRESLMELDWVEQADARARDQGHVFHVEVFVVPTARDLPTLEELEQAWVVCTDLDWKLHDLVIIPVDELPAEFLPHLDEGNGQWQSAPEGHAD